MELPSTAFSNALDKTPTSSRSALSHVIFSISEQRKSARSIKIGSRDVSLHALSTWWTGGQTCKGLQLGWDRTSSIHYAFTLKDSTSSYCDAACVSSGEVQWQCRAEQFEGLIEEWRERKKKRWCILRLNVWNLSSFLLRTKEAIPFSAMKVSSVPPKSVAYPHPA